jgi:hypothetical protein
LLREASLVKELSDNRADCDELFIAVRDATEREADVSRRLMLLEAERSELRGQNAKLQAELAAVRAECDELFVRPVEMREVDAAEIARLRQANDGLERCQGQTAEELRQARATISELQRSGTVVRQELLASRQECDHLRMIAEELRLVRTNLGEVQRRDFLAQELNAVLSALEKTSAECDNLRLRVCSAEVSKTLQECTTLAQRYDDAQQALQASAEKVAKVESENAALRQGSQSEAEKVQRLTVELESFRIRYDDAQQALQASAEKVARVESENAALRHDGLKEAADAINPALFFEAMSRDELVCEIRGLLEARHEAGLVLPELELESMSSADLLDSLWQLHALSEQDNLDLLSSIWEERQANSTADHGNSPTLIRNDCVQPLPAEISHREARIGELEDEVNRLEGLLCLRNDEIVHQDFELTAAQLVREKVDALACAMSSCDSSAFEQLLQALTKVPLPQELWVDPMVLSDMHRRVEAYEQERELADAELAAAQLMRENVDALACAMSSCDSSAFERLLLALTNTPLPQELCVSDLHRRVEAYELAEAYLGHLLEPSIQSQCIDAQTVPQIPNELVAATALLSSELGGCWSTTSMHADPIELDELDAAKQLLSFVVGGCWLTRNELFVSADQDEDADKIEPANGNCNPLGTESDRSEAENRGSEIGDQYRDDALDDLEARSPPATDDVPSEVVSPPAASRQHIRSAQQEDLQLLAAAADPNRGAPQHALMLQLYQNGDGEVSRGELRQAVAEMGSSTPSRHVMDELMARSDRDHGGKLDCQELQGGLFDAHPAEPSHRATIGQSEAVTVAHNSIAAKHICVGQTSKSSLNLRTSGASAVATLEGIESSSACQQVLDSAELVWLVLTPVITEARGNLMRAQSQHWIEVAWPLRCVCRRWKRAIEAVVSALQFSPHIAMRVRSLAWRCVLP